MNRRRFLEGALLSLGVTAGCNQPDAEPDGTQRWDNQPDAEPDGTQRWEVDPVHHQKLIGAHYYPWYNSDPGWRNWLVRVPDRPVLGEYTSSEAAVIHQHIKWAVESVINWFNVSWLWPNSDESRIFLEEILTSALADRMSFSVLYESRGRFETNQQNSIDFTLEENRVRLRRDFEFLAETFFDHPSYLDIDGKPVIFVYQVSSFTGAVETAFREAKASVGTDVYLIADILGVGPSSLYEGWMSAFDAASIYNIYSPQLVADRAFDGFVDAVDKLSLDWFLAASNADVDVIPNAIPGYNDSLFRENPVLERSPEGFRKLCEIGLERMARGLDAMLITSFNEWPEYTAIEPSETYGETYLDIVREELARSSPEYVNIGTYGELQLAFNETIRPTEINSASTDSRELALLLSEVELLDADGETLVVYDIGAPPNEPHLIEGVYPPESRPGNPSETWRWLGGPTGTSTMYFAPDDGDPTTILLRGKPMVSDELLAEISYNGVSQQTLTLGKRGGEPNEYRIRIETP